MKNRTFILWYIALLVFPACWNSQNNHVSSIGLSLKHDSLFKIIPIQNYDPHNQDDCIKPMPLDIKSGFIHVSFGNQVENILKKFFNRTTNIILLELDAQVLLANGLIIRKEQNKPGGDFFPHIYGNKKIPTSAIVSIIKVHEKSDGEWVIDNVSSK